MNREALTAKAFEEKYLREGDPWNFAGSNYELARYAALLAALPRRRYSIAFEPGCAIGVLTERLAHKCDRIIATDFAPTAVAQARQRCQYLPQVEILCQDLRGFVPTVPLDLIVFSEVGYYFTCAQLSYIAARLAGALVGGGEFLAAHWVGHSDDHVLHADQVHDTLHDTLRLEHVRSTQHCGFRLDLWAKR